MKNVFKLLKDVIICITLYPVSLLPFKYLWCVVHHSSLANGKYHTQYICTECKKEFAIHHGNRTVLKWSKDFEDFYKLIESIKINENPNQNNS